MEMAEVRR